MAKGGSSSQASTNAGSRAGGPTRGAGGPPTGTIRRRPARATGGTGGMGRVSQNVMNFYTDDSPGIKIPPVLVVVLSFCFIAFVSLLHVIGKIRS
ncbi:hypothetical protein BSKO_04222 [Bryopsis sp. KO-2023]|nr:hypothetical protein BSKO_04222 [Bryopsis sp. KO-2023]